jgi:hypothetical protein
MPVLSSDKWKEILEKEKGEAIVCEIVDEIIKSSGEIVFQRYIERKVVPFAVQKAQREILSVAEVSDNCQQSP